MLAAFPVRAIALHSRHHVGLYRDDWLDNIPKSTDILSASGYQDLANAMLPTAGIGTTGTVLGESHLLESMDSMGEKTEGSADQSTAIFDPRTIPDYFA